jgi:hypothetical protein
VSSDPDNIPNDEPGSPPSDSIDAGLPAISAPPGADRASIPSPRAIDGVPVSTVIAAVLGLLTAWMAAGSIGLTGHALRAGLTWLAMGGVLLAALRPGRHRDCPGFRFRMFGSRAACGLSFCTMAVFCGTAVAVVMTASRLPTVQVLAIPVLLGVLAATEPGPGRVVLKTAGEATLVLALYRLAVTSLPVLWLGADFAGEALGELTGRVTGCPLWVGATFAGVDFLVLILYVVLRTPFAFAAIGRDDGRIELAEAAVAETPSAPAARARFRIWAAVPVLETVAALLMVFALHMVFLVVMTHGARWHAELPPLPPPDPDNVLQASPREFVHTIRTLVPWNLLVLAAVFHAVVAAAHWGWWSRRLRRFRAGHAGRYESSGQTRWAPSASQIPWPAAVTIVVSFGVAICLGTHPGWRRPADLDGKKVVLFEEGFLNWNKPVHGDYGSYSVGMYGMFPVYLESLGAQCVVSPDLSADDLSDADVLVLIYPDKPWQEGQLERIWEFVRQGGSLLVMGEHTIREPDVPIEKGGSRFNEVLEPTAMRVRFDSAVFEVGGWLQSYQALAHPTSAGIGDAENEFGAVIGASVDARWPARPLLIGRWGWADPGDVAAGPSMMGNDRYDPGERLGDLVLAAEQPLGRGKIIVFGDTSGLTNGLTVGCYVYTSRLMAYLAESENRPRGLGMQLLALCVCMGLVAFVAWQREAWIIAVAAAACGLVIVIHTAYVHSAGEILPDTAELATLYDHQEASILQAAQSAEAAVLEFLPEPNAEPLTAEDIAEALADAVLHTLPDNVRPFNLAYIDASHLHAYSPEGWRDDGTMGLCLTLMREGYLTLSLPEVTAERLSGANLLVSVAPSRAYTTSEQEAIEQFIRDGGIFIYTIGRDHYAAGRSLLERLRFRVGFPNWDGEGKAEPVPCSHFKTPYPEDENSPGYAGFVRFHAAWPVACLDDPAKRLVITQRAGLTPEEPVFPMIEMRRCGDGLVVVIGDTAFATNQNLERDDGEPIEGFRENADFWRWLLTLLRTGEVLWTPEGAAP